MATAAEGLKAALDLGELAANGSALTRRAGLRIDDWAAWWGAVTRPTALIELALIAACAGLAWGVSRVLLRQLATPTDPEPPSVLLWRRGVDGALFPVLWLALAWLARLLLLHWQSAPLFGIAIPALMALAVIRVGVKVLQRGFPQAHAVRVLERTISWGVWLLLVLWLSGLLPVLLEESDQLSVKVGASELTLRNVLEGALTVAVALLAALWLSSLLEARLLRAAHGATLSLRKVAANAVRALLVFVAVLVALSAVGIDLTALSVLGGAIGVGIGLGLQKLAANYVSGFVVLAERAIRIGDAVRVDGFDGVVTDIRARYTVIRNNSGRESIVPNEMMVTQRVENQSLADRRVWASTVVSVGYDSDIEQVLQLLRQAAMTCPRVLREPPPNAFLSAFGADGLECTLGYWMNEPEGGQLGLRSQINVAVLHSLRAHGVDIPYPQRVVQWRDAPPPAQAASGPPAAAPERPTVARAPT